MTFSGHIYEIIGTHPQKTSHQPLASVRNVPIDDVSITEKLGVLSSLTSYNMKE